MEITGYNDKAYSSKISGKPYEVLINPEKLTWNKSVEYSDVSPQNSGYAGLKYKSSNTETLDFELVIDATGIIDSKRVHLTTELDRLNKIVYNYNGKNHRPNFVVIRWGKSTAFKGVLKSLNTTYKLFKPNGVPIRATVALSFSSSLDSATRAKKEDKNSPDLTHLVDVKMGDTLPQISQTYYDDTDYFIEISKFNKLNKFRNLHVGTQLVLPPLVEGENT